MFDSLVICQTFGLTKIGPPGGCVVFPFATGFCLRQLLELLVLKGALGAQPGWFSYCCCGNCQVVN